MRNSNLLKWAHTNSSKQTNKNGNRSWIHSSDALQRGHIAYLVKYLGSTEVDEPKGIEVVKEGIRKLTFNQQLKKSEGNKIPKVELTISIDGVAIQEPKTKRIMNQYPLHRISYCADDKGEKKFFSFIAKEQDADQHICFVFVSDKLAEEITLTIGQAFDLAYRRFLETSGKDLDTHRHVIMLQQKLKRLEMENTVLRQRLHDVSQLAPKRTMDEWMIKEGITELLGVEGEAPSTVSSVTSASEAPSSTMSTDLFSDTTSSAGSFSSSSFGNGSSPPPVPPRAMGNSTNSFNPLYGDLLSRDTGNGQPTVGTKLEGLLLQDLEDDFNPRAFESTNGSSKVTANLINGAPFFNSSAPLLSSPPKVGITPRPRPHASTSFTGDGFPPLNIPSSPPGNSKPQGNSMDLFGMESFSNNTSAPPFSPGQEMQSTLGFLDKRIMEMKDGFSRGLSIGNDDFSLESLDPLRN